MIKPGASQWLSNDNPSPNQPTDDESGYLRMMFVYLYLLEFSLFIQYLFRYLLCNVQVYFSNCIQNYQKEASVFCLTKEIRRHCPALWTVDLVLKSVHVLVLTPHSLIYPLAVLKYMDLHVYPYIYLGASCMVL